MRVKFIIFVSLYFIVAHIQCSSVEKYNSHLASKVSVADLQSDINYVEYKINKLHPALDWYISKEALANKFDSLRTTITEPLTPNEFYFKISPVVASVKTQQLWLLAQPQPFHEHVFALPTGVFPLQHPQSMVAIAQAHPLA